MKCKRIHHRIKINFALAWGWGTQDTRAQLKSWVISVPWSQSIKRIIKIIMCFKSISTYLNGIGWHIMLMLTSPSHKTIYYQHFNALCSLCDYWTLWIHSTTYFTLTLSLHMLMFCSCRCRFFVSSRLVLVGA